MALNSHLIDCLEAIAMSLIVEVSESGTLQLPAEILQAIGPNTRFIVEVESAHWMLPILGSKLAITIFLLPD